MISFIIATLWGLKNIVPSFCLTCICFPDYLCCCAPCWYPCCHTAVDIITDEYCSWTGIFSLLEGIGGAILAWASVSEAAALCALGGVPGAIIDNICGFAG